MSWLSNLLGGPTVAYKIIEVEKRPAPSLETSEVKATLAVLPENPGFLYLMARFRMQKAVIERTLKYSKQESKEDYAWLQAGIFWAEWFENETNRLTKRAAAIEADTTHFEEDAFKHIDSMLERVGSQS